VDKRKIKFAASMIVKALEPYVEEILEVISHHVEKEIKTVFISDESQIAFCLINLFESEEDNAGNKTLVTTQKSDQALRNIGKDLGFKIDYGDYIAEIAIKLKKREVG